MKAKAKHKSYDSLHVRIPRNLKARLRKRSESKDRSMTQYMLDALEEKLASEDTDLKTGPGVGTKWVKDNMGAMVGKLKKEDIESDNMTGFFLRKYLNQ